MHYFGAAQKAGVVRQLVLVPFGICELVEHEMLYVGQHFVRGMLVEEVFVAYGLEFERVAEKADTKVEMAVVLVMTQHFVAI